MELRNKLIELLSSSNDANYTLALHILGATPILINKKIAQLIEQNVLVGAKDDAYLASSSPLLGYKILEIARAGLKQFIVDLQQLDLSYVQFFDGLEELQNLKEVRFYDNKIQQLPAQLFELPKLEKLYIRLNPLLNFEQLCSDLASIKTLKGLYLENNALQVVPSTLQQLPQLQFLRFNNRQMRFPNQITKIPNFILQLQQLTELNFWDNPIQSYPPTLFQFAQQQLHSFHIGRHSFSTGALAVEYLKLFKTEGLKTQLSYLHYD